MWYKRDDNTVLFSTRRNLQKARNLARDPRVTVAIYDQGNPYHSIEIRGRAELIPDPERALSVELSHRYLGVDPPNESESDPRVIIRVIPEKITGFKIPNPS
jgi:PPOX class probable F420-dependent enzyme